jgi:hypothetical protein
MEEFMPKAQLNWLDGVALTVDVERHDQRLRGRSKHCIVQAHPLSDELRARAHDRSLTIQIAGDRIETKDHSLTRMEVTARNI